MKLIALITFYLLSFIPGFWPYVYESDRNSFIANQIMWVLATIVLYILSSDKRLKAVSVGLILLTSFELLDEFAGVNNYAPETITQIIRLDFFIIICITALTIYKLIKAWKT